MSRADAVYMSSPVWLQRALVAGYGWWWHRRRFGPQFRRAVGELRAHESWTHEQFQAYQDARLSEILRVASQSPHYAPLLLRAGGASSTSPRQVLARMPLLDKQQLRSRPRELLTAPPPRGTVVFRSSGTTGTPTEIYYTREFHAMETASIEVRNLNWAGVSYSDRRVMFGARKICRFDQRRPPFWRISPAEDLAYASVYHLTPEFLPAYLAFLRAFRPRVIMGYPSALYAVAQYALASGDMPSPARGVFTSAERVTDCMRAAIERVWQCRLYDRYGAVEGCASASQCEHGRYHVNPEVGLLEILNDDGQAAAPGAEGEVVCTGLHNRLQPLIRYRIGDTARWAVQQACPCGRQMPVLDGIDGRVEDVCYTADGRRIVRFDTVFKGIGTIREAQVVQHRIDAFTLVVVPIEGFCNDDVRQLKRNMRAHVGEAKVAVECVREIPRTDAGKFRAVVCRLAAADKQRLVGSAGAPVGVTDV
jgi:phenylacetate-CoA ligase